MESLRDRWSELSPTDQNIIIGITLFLGLLLVRRLVVGLLLRWLRNLAGRTATQRDDQLLEMLTLPIRLITLAALMLIVGLGARVGTQLMDRLVLPGVNTLVTLAVLVFLFKLAQLLTSDDRYFNAYGFDAKLLPFVRTGLQVVVISLAVVIIFNHWGYDINGLVAGLGIGGLAVALAAQDTLANLFGFTTIVGDHPLVVGEYIKTPDVEGTVEHVGLRSTRIRQPDQAYVTVPNRTLANAPILNWSRLAKRRYNTLIGITYETTPDQMEVLLERLRDMLKERPHVEVESVVVYFIEFGESSLQILVRCYILLSDWGEFTAERQAINLNIMRIIKELGLNIAFPSRSVYLKTVEESSSEEI